MKTAKKLKESTESAETEVKQKRTYRKKDYSIDQYSLDLSNVIVENLDTIESIATKYLNNNFYISKEDWTLLHDIVKYLCVKFKGHPSVLCPFRKEHNDIRYKEEHSAYYYVVAKSHINGMLTHINYVKTHIPSDQTNEKEVFAYRLTLCNVAYHLFYFVTAKEKL